MLAQNFMTPEALHLTDKQHSALVHVLGMLERGELKHHLYLNDPLPEGVGFNMGTWNLYGHNGHEQHCGTVACIGGTAEIISEIPNLFGVTNMNCDLHELFFPSCDSVDSITLVTVPQAAMALRSYLTTGKPNWKDAIGANP